MKSIKCDKLILFDVKTMEVNKYLLRRDNIKVKYICDPALNLSDIFV